jgi:hypothetical protein
MPHEFSFSPRQWWIAVACSVLVVMLVLAVGFVGGALWQRGRAAARATAPASAAAPAPAPAPAP